VSYAKRRVLDGHRVRYTGVYRDPADRLRSAGTFDSKRVALAEARSAEAAIKTGSWIDPSDGRITFHDYVEKHWGPSRHLELSTRAGFRYNLDKHFLPFFGDLPMRSIMPSTVKAWVTAAVATGLSPRSVVKYHVMLHNVFKRAVRDRVILHNPARETELPKVVARSVRILTPDEFARLLPSYRRATCPWSSPTSRPACAASSSPCVPWTWTSCAGASWSSAPLSR
jgi:hypothetical protein